MKPHKRLLGVALLLIALMTALALALVHRNAPQPVSGRVLQGGALRVGFAVEMPYAYFDAQGQVTGMAPDVFRAMAQRMGIERLEWVRMDFAHLLTELQLGRIDAIATGMFITPDRELIASFTQPMAWVRPALVVRQGQQTLPLRPQQAHLKSSPQLRFATIHGAIETAFLQHNGIPPERVITVPDALRALRAVADGTVDAFAISAVTAWQLVARHPEWPLEVRTVVDAPAGLPAFAFRLGDQALRDAMNQHLNTYVGSEEHRLLAQRHGFTSDELPADTP